MYRVLLKVDKLTIRVKEAVEVQILIKKDHNFFNHCTKQLLINGEINLVGSSQFLIDSKNPKFQLEIFLSKGSLRKIGGVVEIDLRKYSTNTSHRINQMVKKSPAANSWMLIDFMYMQTDRIFQNQSLISLRHIQQINHQQYLKVIVKENEELQMKNTRLNEQIQKLKCKNGELKQEFKNIEDNMESKENAFNQQIRRIQNEQAATMLTVQIQKKKIHQIVQIINESGDPDLINQIETIINDRMDEQR